MSRESYRGSEFGTRAFFVRDSQPRLLLGIARVPQLGDVTNGLIYVHDQDVVHGNLKGVRFQTP